MCVINKSNVKRTQSNKTPFSSHDFDQVLMCHLISERISHLRMDRICSPLHLKSYWWPKPIQEIKSSDSIDEIELGGEEVRSFARKEKPKLTEQMAHEAQVNRYRFSLTSLPGQKLLIGYQIYGIVRQKLKEEVNEEEETMFPSGKFKPKHRKSIVINSHRLFD